MKIKVCDALCGSGKTSACIRMMNEETDKRFIFVTQFLSEVDRIMTKCSSRGFVTPDNDVRTRKTKLSDLKTLLVNGQNIATTHALFVCCTDEVKELIRKQHYVLVLDETVEIMKMAELKQCDVNLLSYAKVIEKDDEAIRWVYDQYEQDDEDGDGLFWEAVQLSKSKNLLSYKDKYYCWSLPPDLFECFDSVYVLTYMFYAQLLKGFFDAYGLKYELIGVKEAGEQYEFCPLDEMNRARELRDKIHILEHKKLNEIGNRRADLSYSSYSLHTHRLRSGLEGAMRKNLVNLFRNIFHAPCNQIMWTVFKGSRAAVSSKGYAGGFVPYNKRASNDYANRHYLAYCVNNFLRPWEINFYKEHGATLNNDAYGLSFLVQWIFRSGIRNGDEIWVYIPSARMRSLLKQWLAALAEGKDLEPISYKGSRKQDGQSKRKEPDKETRKDGQANE
jgi:hypothetical protein